MPSSPTSISRVMRDRARGVLLGQLVGDALGTTVEFSDPEDIRRRFGDGLRDIVGGGPYGVDPGQVTDDGELALALARTLVAHGWDLDARARAYASWIKSGPFDIGNTTRAAFSGWRDVSASTMIARAHERNGASTQQANGALMCVSPLAIYGAVLDPKQLAERAREDARFSHPSTVCQASNAAFVRAIQIGLSGGTPTDGYDAAREAVGDCNEVVMALADVKRQPQCHGSKQGWVLIALRNAFYMLMHETSFEEALVRTVMAGGDADTNACIAGALLGAFHGLDGIPPRWLVKVLSCRTARGATYQTSDAIVLADGLLEQGAAVCGGTATVDRSSNLAQSDDLAPAIPHRAGSRPERRRSLDDSSRQGIRTSDAYPIRVDWLPLPLTRGKVGITIAPGKHSSSTYSGGHWARDLDTDLQVLINEWRADVLVCLLEQRDLVRLKIPDLIERARALGLETISFPIRDVSVPTDTGAVHQLVLTIRDHAVQGKNVVIHCEGGLGRSGVIAGCYLALTGLKVDEIFDTLVRSRGRNCPETEIQRRFIRSFAREFGSAS